MKASRLIFTLLLASSVAVVQLAAQQTKADQRPLKEVRAKAEEGDAESQAELGLRYEQGKGVAKDQVEAVKWYRKAAEQNYANAQYNLSVCYAHGEGVAKDNCEAYKWRLLAARQGDDDAKKNIAALESKLTPEQIVDGKRGRAILSRARRGCSRPLTHHLVREHSVPVYKPAKRCA